MVRPAPPERKPLVCEKPNYALLKKSDTARAFRLNLVALLKHAGWFSTSPTELYPRSVEAAQEAQENHLVIKLDPLFGKPTLSQATKNGSHRAVALAGGGRGEQAVQAYMIFRAKGKEETRAQIESGFDKGKWGNLTTHVK